VPNGVVRPSGEMPRDRRYRHELGRSILVGLEIQRDAIPLTPDTTVMRRPVTVQPWVVNDRHYRLDGCRIILRLEDQDGSELLTVRDEQVVDVAADAVCDDLAMISFELPAETAPGAKRVVVWLEQDGTVLSENVYDLTVTGPRAG
jgi:hypothetical protein